MWLIVFDSRRTVTRSGHGVSGYTQPSESPSLVQFDHDDSDLRVRVPGLADSLAVREAQADRMMTRTKLAVWFQSSGCGDDNLTQWMIMIVKLRPDSEAVTLAVSVQ
eukprot:2692484-Rhodomonas_salina.1